MKRNVNDVANVLISAAIIKSIEIRKLDPISVKRIVMGVCIGPAEVSMILTAGLVYATTYVASYEYESTSASKIKKLYCGSFMRRSEFLVMYVLMVDLLMDGMLLFMI